MPNIAPTPEKIGADQAIGRSRGGLSTKISTLVEAPGNPTAFPLTGGEAHDPVGADHLLPGMQAGILSADKAFDADERVLESLAASGKAVVIPPRARRRSSRRFDRAAGKARHPIGNFFAKLKKFRAIATRCDKTARNFLAAIHLTATASWLNGRQAPAGRRPAPFRLESTTDRLSRERERRRGRRSGGFSAARGYVFWASALISSIAAVKRWLMSPTASVLERWIRSPISLRFATARS